MTRFVLVSAILGAAVLGSGCVVSTRAATYDECNTSSDCRAGDTCTQVITDVSNGRMCTHSCFSHADCGGPAGLGGSCYMIFGDPDPSNFICYQRCVNDFDCFAGSACLTATMGGVATDAVCFPIR